MTDQRILGLGIDVVQRVVARPVVFGAFRLHDGPRHAIQQIRDLWHHPKCVSQCGLRIRRDFVAVNIARRNVETLDFFGREVVVGHRPPKT